MMTDSEQDPQDTEQDQQDPQEQDPQDSQSQAEVFDPSSQGSGYDQIPYNDENTDSESPDAASEETPEATPQETPEAAPHPADELSLDPRNLGQPTIDHATGDVSYANGRVIAHTKVGLVSVNVGGTKILYDGHTGKKVDIQHESEPKIHMVKDERGVNIPMTYENGELVPVKIHGGSGSSLPGPPEGVTGDAALEGLNPAQVAFVKAYGGKEPTLQAPTSLARNPMFAELYPYIAAYNPKWTAQTYNLQKNLRTEFSKGGPTTLGGAVSIGRTALRHLNEAWEAFQKLKNSKFKGYNSIKNMVAKQVNDPDLAAYKTAMRNLSGEVAKAFTGAAPQLDTIHAQMDNMDPTGDDESTLRSLQTTASMIYQRMDEISQKWAEGFDEPYPRLLDEPAKKALKAFYLLGDDDKVQDPDAAAPPAVGTTKLFRKKDKSGYYVIKDGKKIATDEHGIPLTP